jgi:very-short-patch-repair endonuclease
MLIFVGWSTTAALGTIPCVHSRIRRLVDEQGGVVRRQELLAVVEHLAMDRAHQLGHLARVLPATYVDPASLSDRHLMLHAALAYVEGLAALSHTTALEVWGLPTVTAGPIHLVTNRSHHFRGAPSVRVHRREDFVCEPPDVVMRGGLPVTRLERAIVDSWSLLDGDLKRAPAIYAVGQRMTTPARLRKALENQPRLAGRRYFHQLVELLAAGCRSHLELWGYREIFSGPEFAGLKWQEPVRLGQRTVYLDVYDPETGVNFELDGAKHHANSWDRDRDLRRDAALQALGLVVVRLTHDWMLQDPLGVRRSALAIMASRR